MGQGFRRGGSEVTQGQEEERKLLLFITSHFGQIHTVQRRWKCRLSMFTEAAAPPT